MVLDDSRIVAAGGMPARDEGGSSGAGSGSTIWFSCRIHSVARRGSNIPCSEDRAFLREVLCYAVSGMKVGMTTPRICGAVPVLWPKCSSQFLAPSAYMAPVIAGRSDGTSHTIVQACRTWSSRRIRATASSSHRIQPGPSIELAG